MARLLAEKGNANRLLGEFLDAHRDLREALRVRNETTDEHATAAVLHLAAVYSKDVQDFSGAKALGSRALQAYRNTGDGVGVERAERLLAAVPFVQGDLAAAQDAFYSLLDRGISDPLTELSVVSHLVKIHVLQGEVFKAGRLLSRLRELAAEWTESRIQVTLKWLRSLVIGGVGEPHRAAELLGEVRQFFLEQGVLIDAGLVSLDCAFMYLKSGHKADAAIAASEATMALAAAQPDNPATLAAIRTFEEATREAEVSQAVYRETVLQVVRERACRHSPDLALCDGIHGI